MPFFPKHPSHLFAVILHITFTFCRYTKKQRLNFHSPQYKKNTSAYKTVFQQKNTSITSKYPESSRRVFLSLAHSSFSLVSSTFISFFYFPLSCHQTKPSIQESDAKRLESCVLTQYVPQGGKGILISVFYDPPGFNFSLTKIQTIYELEIKLEFIYEKNTICTPQHQNVIYLFSIDDRNNNQNFSYSAQVRKIMILLMASIFFSSLVSNRSFAARPHFISHILRSILFCFASRIQKRRQSSRFFYFIYNYFLIYENQASRLC